MTSMTTPPKEQTPDTLRTHFEALASDPSFKLSRSRRGTYVNPAVARDWKWFQLGASQAQQPAPSAACVICGSDEPFTGTCGSSDPRALCKQPAPSAAVFGLRLVPVEPTDQMVQAAQHIDLSYMPGQEGADRAAIYRAMIAAAPQPAVQQWNDLIGKETHADADGLLVWRDEVDFAIPKPQADSAPAAAPADTVVLEAALCAIHQAIDLIGEPDTERLRTVRRVLRGAVVVAEDSNAPQADSQPVPNEEGFWEWWETYQLPDGWIARVDLVAWHAWQAATIAARTPADSVTAPAGETNTKTEELLSTTVGLLMGYREGGPRQPYKPGSVIAKTVDEVVEHLKNWPYPEPTPPAQAADSVLEDADPLQGAANWLAEAHGQFGVAVLQGCLMIGYNRAKRLHDAAIAARKQGDE